MVIVSGVIVGAATFLFRKALFGSNKPAIGGGTPLAVSEKSAPYKPPASASKYNPDKDFVLKMRGAGKNVVIFYGSQTGTAEDFSTRLAKELQSTSVRPLVLDPELYDWQCLASLGEEELVIFVLATTGEGEATDNMETWFNALASDHENPEDSELPEFRQPEDKPYLDPEQPLESINYVMFGLGNNTYEQFNHHARVVDKRLETLGGLRLGERGEGDDDADIEEDFSKWKEATLPLISQFFGSSTPLGSAGDGSAGGAPPEPTWKIIKVEGNPVKQVWVQGEFTEKPATVFDARHPYNASVSAAVELTPTADRHVLHVEVDLEGSGMRYESGDHIGVYPTNSDEEVDLLLESLGILDQADVPISVRATDPFAAQQSLFPVEVTTYRTAFRHYLEITGPVPRAQIKSLVLPFAKSEQAREFLLPLANDKDAHAATVSSGCMSLARLINAVREKGGDPQFVLPVEAALELCPRLQARFYSISSSHNMRPHNPTMTAVVLQYDAKTSEAALAKMGQRRCGVATNYLYGALRYLRGDCVTKLVENALRTGLLLSDSQNVPKDASAAVPAVKDSKGHHLGSFTLYGSGEGDANRGLTMPVFIRKSAFRLPSDSSIPIIMIGPGTGLAPMRGFVHERARMARNGQEVGTTLLFFGARTQAHDYMYQEELEECFDEIKQEAPESQIITAFSRDQPDKIYVQHRLTENAQLVYNTLLCGQPKLNGPPKAHIYVCGEAKNMAKDVTKALITLIAQSEGVSEETASGWISEMRKLSRYQEDVWS